MERERFLQDVLERGRATAAALLLARNGDSLRKCEELSGGRHWLARWLEEEEETCVDLGRACPRCGFDSKVDVERTSSAEDEAASRPTHSNRRTKDVYLVQDDR